jgi:hypothetical protein
MRRSRGCVSVMLGFLISNPFRGFTTYRKKLGQAHKEKYNLKPKKDEDD